MSNVKLFYAERKFTLVLPNSGIKVAPMTSFECTNEDAGDLLRKYPGKVFQDGSAEHKDFLEKLNKKPQAKKKPSPAAKTKDVKAAIEL